jgi:2-polyprenyl-6-methoxyphenol hydroxylase-like FAD-dependent oxidoreductase
VIALLPLASSKDDEAAMSLVWSAPDAVADRLIGEPADAIAARLSALCATRTDSAVGPLTSLGAIADVPLTMQWATRTIASRAALVGDAAHVIHPLAGQGLNLGFADVEALIEILATRPSFRDCGDAVLLRRYERSRVEPVFAMRRMTDGLARLFGSERPELVRLRGFGMRALDRAGPLKRLLVQQAAGSRRTAR